MRQQEAKEKWCPFVQVSAVNGGNSAQILSASLNILVINNRGNDKGFNCLGEDCALWNPYSHGSSDGECGFKVIT